MELRRGTSKEGKRFDDKRIQEVWKRGKKIPNE